VRSSLERVSIAIAVALMVAVGAMTALAFAGHRSPADLWNAIRAGPEDGSWTAISIDGKPLEPERYRISIGNGEVTGGRDDCNDWSYDEEETKDGDRMIVSTLVGCPEGDPLREAYWRLVYDPKMEMMSDGKLRVSGHGHQATLIRCRWERVRETLPGGGISDMMRCLPVIP
jgi:hypothetical protein